MKAPGYNTVMWVGSLALMMMLGFGLGAAFGGVRGDCICTPTWLDAGLAAFGTLFIFWLGAAFQKHSDWIGERIDEWLDRVNREDSS